MVEVLLLALALALSVAAWAAAKVVYHRWIRHRIVGGDDGYPDQAAIDRFRHYLNACEGTDFGADDEALRAFLLADDASIEPEVVEAIRDATARTLRVVASWGPVEQDAFYGAARQIEKGYLEDVCPVCEEVTCDEGCPLASIRPTWKDPD